MPLEISRLPRLVALSLEGNRIPKNEEAMMMAWVESQRDRLETESQWAEYGD